MKRSALLVLLLFVLIPCRAVYAEADSATSACLMNALTGDIVFEKNADEKLPMASTTKIMTLLVALDKSDPDETVRISENAAAQEGSSAYLRAGAELTMNDLLYGLMLNSGNDAAVAVAEHISGSSEKFAEEMNKLARKIGAYDTSFKNPNGLDQVGHYTTAKDLALITKYALKNEDFCRIVSAKSHTAIYRFSSGSETEVEYINHNKMLSSYEGCIGVKTGYTKACGRCLVTAARRGDACYIAVTLNDPNDWQEHRELLDDGFAGTRFICAVEKGECIRHLVSGDDDCALIAAEGFTVPVDGSKGKNITVKVNLPESIVPLLNKGEKAGSLDIYCDDTYVGSVDIVADKDISIGEDYRMKPCFFTTVKRLIRDLIG